MGKVPIKKEKNSKFIPNDQNAVKEKANMRLSELSEVVENMISDWNAVYEEILKKLEPFPGRLYVKKEKKRNRYYFRNPGETYGEYLGTGREQMIIKLENNEYYSRLKTVLENNRSHLVKIKNIVSKMTNPEKVYFDIPAEKRNLIDPLNLEEKIILHSTKVVAEWNKLNKLKIKYSGRKGTEGKTVYATSNGEKVRSKSELIIAEKLKAADVPYRYEENLVVANSKGDLEGWYPDFTVLNKRTAKIYYWEHFGRMDDPDYCSAALGKLEIYAFNGLFPGNDLIVSIESSKHVIDTEYIDKLIKKYLK